MVKKLILAGATAMMLISFAGCKGDTTVNKENNDEDKIHIVASINPIREFAEAVGGDRVSVSILVPEGVEAHDFEPKPRDIELLAKADIFAYNGAGMESWLNQVLQIVANKKNLTIVDSSVGANLIYADDEHEEAHETGEEHDHTEGDYDPHIWLSLKEAKQQSLNIKNALVAVDDKNKEYYEENYQSFAAKLDELYNEYMEKFNSVNNKYFITGHSAFAYLGRDFGITQKAVTGIRAEGEPTAQALKELTEFSKVNNIKVVFMEEMAAPEVSETIAREINAKVEKLYSIETKEDEKGYIDMMRENLEKIYNSLK